jgi:hypothetical protein
VVSELGECKWAWPDFDDELFEGAREKIKLTRREKRMNRRERLSQVEVGAQQMAKMQREDETLADIVQSAEDQADDHYIISDGMEYRKGRTKELEAIEQLVLPRSCRPMVLQLAHAIPLAGHLGKRKTTQRILRRFFWPGMYKDIADFCRSCEDCQKNTSSRGPKARLVPMPVVEKPFQSIAMDIVGPLRRSRAGHRYVLVICDYATRSPEAIALRSIDAEHIAEELLKLFSRVGITREMLTDEGTNFVSQLLKELYNLMKIEGIKTSPYHPQTDGLVERFNQALKGMLRRAAKEEGKDWDKLLPYLLFAYREVPQATTGFSPFQLLYGRHVRGPLDVLKESWEKKKKSSESIISYVMQVQERLMKMRHLVKDNVEKSQRAQKVWYDRNARERTLSPEDQVLILLPTSTSKTWSKWQGPYQVIRKVGPVTYEVHTHDKKKTKGIFHINMLKKWHPPAADVCYTTDEGETEESEIVHWRDEEVGEPEISDHLSQQQKQEILELITEFTAVFSNEPGRTTLVQHHIETGNAVPHRQPPYRLPMAYREQVRRELDEMLDRGLIVPSVSEWASPIVIVRKKDNSIRFCVDYRKLNQVTRVDAYPMPRVDELIDLIGNATFITVLDLTRGYWQVPMSPQSQRKTAFITPYGLFEFTVMPFGLQGAPASFQRMMDQIIRGIEDYTADYIDDLVIFSTEWGKHLEHIRMVLTRLGKANLTVKLRKCQFAMDQCRYLGHVVGSGRVQMEVKIGGYQQVSVTTNKERCSVFPGVDWVLQKIHKKLCFHQCSINRFDQEDSTR